MPANLTKEFTLSQQCQTTHLCRIDSAKPSEWFPFMILLCIVCYFGCPGNVHNRELCPSERLYTGFALVT